MRVIAGRFRGRPLRAPRGLTTRPTTDRAREAIFQILGPLDGATVVDFYAGTGALGIEALSRGAARTVFIETDRAALRAIRENLERLDLVSQAAVLDVAVERAKKRLAPFGPFDLVLADPPWPIAQAAAARVAEVVLEFLSPDARVLLGHAAANAIALPAESGLVLSDRRKWGGSGMSFYERARDSDAL